MACFVVSNFDDSQGPGVGAACHVLLRRLGGEQDAEPQLRRSTPQIVGLYRGTRVLEKLVHRPGGIIVHILKDVGVSPERHRGIGVALSPICPDSRPRWGK